MQFLVSLNRVFCIFEESFPEQTEKLVSVMSFPYKPLVVLATYSLVLDQIHQRVIDGKTLFGSTHHGVRHAFLEVVCRR